MQDILNLLDSINIVAMPIRGIELVNCIYFNPETKQFWLIDYRVFDPERNGKGKMAHVEDMPSNVVHHKKLPLSTVLMDSWYANKQLMLYIHRLNKKFYCPIKKNRLAYVGEANMKFNAVSDLDWSDTELRQGKPVQLRFMSSSLPLKLFMTSISTKYFKQYS